MSMRMRPIVTLFLICGLVPAARGEIFECVDESGNKRFTNIRAEAKGCRQLNVGPVNSVPPPATGKAPAKGAAATPTPAGFPRVDQQTQQSRDSERRRILEQEMANEQKLLDAAKKELAEQEAVRLGSERNYQRVLDRLEPYQRKVKLHEDNIANLRKELTNLR